MDARLKNIFPLLAVSYALCWWGWITLWTPNPALDVLEAVAWSAHPQWGYYKSPPLAMWLYTAVTSLFGYRDWALHMLPALSILATFLLVCKTAGRFLPPARAALASALLSCLHYFNYSIAEFNNNILELPIWALAGWAFVSAILDRGIRHWLWLGVALALALYTKYVSVLLLASMALYIVVYARDLLKTPGPYMAAILALILYSPHLYWLASHDFLSLRYAFGRTGLEGEPYDLFKSIKRAASLVASQAAMLLPLLCVVTLCGRRNAHDHPLVRMLAFAPFTLLTLYVLATGGKAKDMWATPCWNFLGIWLVMRFDLQAGKRAMGALAVINALYLAIYAGAMRLGPDSTGKIRREHFAGSAFAQAVQERAAAHHIKDSAIVISDTWLGGNLHYHLPSHPDVLVEGNHAFSPWIGEYDVARNGALIVWKNELPDFLRAQFPHAYSLGKVEGAWQAGKGYAPVNIVVFYLPPTAP